MVISLSDSEPEDVPDLPENVIPVDFEQSRKKAKEAREIKW
jgi:hypothetical protein